ncbi:hypothetical protein BMS3Bbin11_00227 [bacterium BMS3Bbin11]|nr:hypothetical protein BMS3Bbin11_00227 [bacterium BMS3Bbin11]
MVSLFVTIGVIDVLKAIYVDEQDTYIGFSKFCIFNILS